MGDGERSSSTLSLSLCVSSCSLANLWSLDTLGIKNEKNKFKAILEKSRDTFMKLLNATPPANMKYHYTGL